MIDHSWRPLYIRGRAEQQAVHDLLVSTEQWPKLLRHGTHGVEVAAGQYLGDLNGPGGMNGFAEGTSEARPGAEPLPSLTRLSMPPGACMDIHTLRAMVPIETAFCISL